MAAGLAGAGIVAVRVADLRSPLRRPLREGERTALTAAGGEEIRTGEMVVFCKPVAVAPAVVRRDGRVQAGGHPADHARLGVIEQQLDEMAGQPGVIDQVAAQAVPRGKVKGTARRSMTMAAALRAVLLMAPDAGGLLRGDPVRPVRGPGAAALARAVRRAHGHGAGHLAGRGRPGAAAAAAGHGRWPRRTPSTLDHDYRAVQVGDLRAGVGRRVGDPDAGHARRTGRVRVGGDGDDSAPYPQLRDLPVTDASTRGMLAVVTGPSGGDKAAAEQALLDRALTEYAWVFTKKQAVRDGPELPRHRPDQAAVQVTHVLIRLKSDITVTKAGDFLPDGSYMADIGGKDQKIRMRVIEYYVDVDGQDVPEMFCLVTDLHDWQPTRRPRWPPRISGGGTGRRPRCARPSPRSAAPAPPPARSSGPHCPDMIRLEARHFRGQ